MTSTSVANEVNLTTSANNNTFVSTRMSNVPPPKIPEIFKSSLPLLDQATVRAQQQTSTSQLPPLEIPEVFRHSSTSTSVYVASEVFTNPNYWLKTTNNWGVDPQKTKKETRKTK